LMARATARLERSAFGREGPHTIVVRYVRMRSHVCIRKSAWGNVSLIWCAGATAPSKRVASYQWATVRRAHLSVSWTAGVNVVRLLRFHSRPTRRHPAARGCDRAQSRSRSGTSGARTAVQSASSREPQTCRPNAPQRVLALHATPLARRHGAAPSPWSFASTDYNRRERCDPGAPRWRRRPRQVIALSRRLMGQRAQAAQLETQLPDHQPRP
jgi:hypothetical protein